LGQELRSVRGPWTPLRGTPEENPHIKNGTSRAVFDEVTFLEMYKSVWMRGTIEGNPRRQSTVLLWDKRAVLRTWWMKGRRQPSLGQAGWVVASFLSLNESGMTSGLIILYYSPKSTFFFQSCLLLIHSG
jgi:hypothetical protein